MTGMGGLGKTETAVVVGYLVRGYFLGNVWMLRGESEQTMWESVQEMGEYVEGVGRAQENEDRRRYVARLYSKMGDEMDRCLLIVDNAHNFEVWDCSFSLSSSLVSSPRLTLPSASSRSSRVFSSIHERLLDHSKPSRRSSSDRVEIRVLCRASAAAMKPK